MSAAVSPVSSTAPIYNTHDVPPIPKPTLTQQTQTLASTGLSVLEIATALAISTSQVNAALGIQTADPVSSEAGSAHGLSINA